MKGTLILAVLSLILRHADATANCLSCKLSDMKAPLLVSFSYCNATDACLQNKWNYIDMQCKPGGWKRGVLMSIDDCNAAQSTTNTVSSFQST